MRKQRKSKSKLTVLQRKRLMQISFCIAVLSLLWLVFAPGSGMFYLHQQRKLYAELVANTEAMRKQNSELQQEIDRLQNDKKYLEQVAREKHGMLKKNEVVYDFAKE